MLGRLPRQAHGGQELAAGVVVALDARAHGEPQRPVERDVVLREQARPALVLARRQEGDHAAVVDAVAVLAQLGAPDQRMPSQRPQPVLELHAEDVELLAERRRDDAPRAVEMGLHADAGAALQRTLPAREQVPAGHRDRFQRQRRAGEERAGLRLADAAVVDRER
jgi:hypothetical protein